MKKVLNIIKEGDLEALKLYVTAHDVDINSIKDEQGSTCLHEAVLSGNAGIVDHLLDIGADINSLDINLCPPLHHAAYSGNVECMLILLSQGARADIADLDGSTALHKSVYPSIHCTKNNTIVLLVTPCVPKCS